MLSEAILNKIQTELGEFTTGRVIGGDNDFYLRFGYWRRTDLEKLEEILSDYVVIEVDDYDDDCGYLFSYKVKNKI